VERNFRLTMNHNILFDSSAIICQNLSVEHSSNEFLLQRERTPFINRNAAVQPIPLAAPSEACYNTGVVGSNPTGGMDVCPFLFCVCVVLRVSSSLPKGWSSVQGVLPIVYLVKNLKKRQKYEEKYGYRERKKKCPSYYHVPRDMPYLTNEKKRCVK
jgi:hypothetical protein